MLFPIVNGQRLNVTEMFITNMTIVRLLLCMNPVVVLQIMYSGKFSVAYGANMLGFSGMHEVMSLQVVEVEEAHGALITLVWLFTRVGLCVVFQSTL